MCAMVHVHIRASQASLEAARDKAEASTGKRVFSRLRGPSYAFGSDWTYFEWNVGTVNGAVSTEDVAAAWAELLTHLA